jgi:hypothetical protein
MKIWAVCFVFAVALGLTLSTPSFATEEEDKCIQSGLKDLGFYKGEIDGELGNGTKRALKALSKAGLGPDYPLLPQTTTGWCLHIANLPDVGAGTRELAAASEMIALVRIPMVVDPMALSRVFLRNSADEIVAERNTFETALKDGTTPMLIAVFPYAEVKSATSACAEFNKGYAVLDSNGNPFPASCDPAVIAFWDGAFSMNYKTVQQD